MAGWISSKLKVAETLLQQIDQQAAESLGKNEKPQSLSDHLPDAAPKKTNSARPLKYQLPMKPPPPPPLPIGSPSPPDPDGRQRSKPPSPDPAIGDEDWTELLRSPSPKPLTLKTAKKSRIPSLPRKGPGSAPTTKRSPPVKIQSRQEPANEGESNSPVESSVSASEGSSSLARQLDDGEKVGSDTKLEDGSHLLDDSVSKLGDGVGGEESGRTKNVVVASSSGSDTGSDSGSTSDSEDERQRREERRKRRERMMVEKVTEAIKERENVVARLEGEKQSLEKILEERERQQAQEASELQTSMIETMDAVDLEKQKHNSTRMEALTRLTKLETTNTELARELSTTQWNLEEEATRVAELRQQIEEKELAVEGYRRRMSKIHQDTPLSEVESSKRAELEQEILDAEYSLICDKNAKLKEKVKKLEDNILITRNGMVHPTEVEVELKRRLAQLTDHLIQKQTQVEALSSEKATLTFRMETVSRLLDENGLSQQAIDAIDDSESSVTCTSERADIEAGVWRPSDRAHLRDRIRSGQRQLGSVVRQLDAIFGAGLVYLRRNPPAQLFALFYLLCLHVWVMYILMSRPGVSDGAGSGAVFSLEAINKTLSS